MSTKSFVIIGCLLLAAGFVLRGVGFFNPAAVWMIKPSSFLILANTSFILAILVKK